MCNEWIYTTQNPRKFLFRNSVIFDSSMLVITTIGMSLWICWNIQLFNFTIGFFIFFISWLMTICEHRKWCCFCLIGLVLLFVSYDGRPAMARALPFTSSVNWQEQNPANSFKPNSYSIFTFYSFKMDSHLFIDLQIQTRIVICQCPGHQSNFFFIQWDFFRFILCKTVNFCCSHANNTSEYC